MVRLIDEVMSAVYKNAAGCDEQQSTKRRAVTARTTSGRALSAGVLGAVGVTGAR